MGKITRYHPVSLHVIRGGAEYCGFKFGVLKQVKSDPTGMTATYKAEVKLVPKRVSLLSLMAIRQELQNCFNAEIKVPLLQGDSDGNMTATIIASVYRDESTLPLPEPEIKPIEVSSTRVKA